MKDKKKSKNTTVSSWWEERHKILQSTTKNKPAKAEVKIKKAEAKKTATLPAPGLSQPTEHEAFLLVGDVHANLPALKAVLEDASNRGISTIWNVGDLTGYGAFPDDVVKRLRKENAQSVVGNYDLKVLKIKERKEEEGEKEELPEDWNAIKWTYDNLSKKNRRYLKSLPEELRLEAGGKRILLTHRSPLPEIGPETPDERLREFALLADADVIIFGHSHLPFSRQVDGVWFINPGGTGRQDDGDPRASYAILQINPRSETLPCRL